MAETRFRNYETPQDAERQYRLWMAATEGLPYCWRTNLPLVQHLIQNAQQHPESRIYAERGGDLVGYIGTHPPVRWATGDVLLPFGYPWTVPHDPWLSSGLYERMARRAPGVYAGEVASGYVQRFRSSWQRQLNFFRERGWRELERLPLVARPIADPGQRPPMPAERVLPEDLPCVAEYAEADPCTSSAVDLEDLRHQLNVGWLEWDGLWHVPGTGVFELGIRGPWAEVRLCHVKPSAAGAGDFWHAIDAVAHAAGAEVVYFVLPQAAAERRGQLAAQGFKEDGAGVFLVYEL